MWWCVSGSRLFAAEYEGEPIPITTFMQPGEYDELAVPRVRLLRELNWIDFGIYDASAIAGAPISTGQLLTPRSDLAVLVPASSEDPVVAVALEDQLTLGDRIQVASAPREHSPVRVLTGAAFAPGSALTSDAFGRAIPAREGDPCFVMAYEESAAAGQLVSARILQRWLRQSTGSRQAQKGRPT
jgi:hypothetical protein